MISTAQVQMEFMKNRQKTILRVLDLFKPGKDDQLELPPIIADAKSVSGLRLLRKDLKKRRDQAADRVASIMMNPAVNDPVFRAVQNLFTDPTSLILGRENEQRFAIRELARKRWELGYPPRKPQDTSIGDAINWEWVVECACQSGGYVIIVSHDEDYGPIHEKTSYLNDWLLKEYKERLRDKGRARVRILLENQLSAALQRMDVKVPQQVIEAEQNLILPLPTQHALASTASSSSTMTGTLT
jgi:hypothetical protein